VYQDTVGEFHPRLESYEEELKRHGHDCLRMFARKGETGPERIRRTGQVLVKARHPVAVFARDDHAAAEVVDACLSAGLLVPEEVAVLGANNDELVCDALRVPLSSIDCNLEGMGYEAASQLDRLMNGEVIGPYVTMIPPKEVITRQSTDILAYDDLDLVKAVQFIRQNSQSGIGVMNVVAATHASKRKLSMLFQAKLGRSILQEITRCRLAHACRLLETTGMKVEAVAAEAGFPNRRSLHIAFQRENGVTPRQHRANTRR
jgi:LacI family transcriptional regulator